MNETIKEYEVCAVFWEDHMHIYRGDFPKNPDELFDRPTLSVGVLISETDKCVVLASDFEPNTNSNDLTYNVILKNSIIARKTYGNIPLSL